jgi:L-ascorbate metabolism protein UlaG (beta-lactamase superfamily)
MVAPKFIAGQQSWHNKVMKITKYEHACLILEEGGQKLVIDPGFYTRPVDGLTDVQAIVITHAHDDHCDAAQLRRIIELNPDVQIFSTDEVCARLRQTPDFNHPATAIHHGDFVSAGNFILEFFGDLHIEIHRSIPLIQNCAVMVNGRLFYPGDSYVQPDRPVEILACPTSAPWLKIGDVMDFVSAIKPKRVFATHNIHLSEQGHELNNSRVKAVAEANGGAFEYLLPGQTVDY